VSASEAERKIEDTVATSEGPRSPDPWGVRRAENLLTSLQGVLSARVEVSPMGEVTAVHVLTHAGTSPKQMVRNVESALLAQLGLKVDHRKISIAQTAEVHPIETLERTAVRGEARRRTVVFKHIDVVAAGGRRARVKVTLSVGGEDISAEEEVADTLKARMQGAARAALTLLSKVVEVGALDLEGVKVVDVFEAKLAVVGVQTLEGRDPETVLGTAPVRDSAERSAVLAVLDATNRWVLLRT
jgi:S-ribosylhomocysteine lyase LuxS involved in autoinducer biosynthesis